MQSLELRGFWALVIKGEDPDSKAKHEHDVLVLKSNPTYFQTLFPSDGTRAAAAAAQGQGFFLQPPKHGQCSRLTCPFPVTG